MPSTSRCESVESESALTAAPATRRTVLKAGMWAAPAILAATAVPLASASPEIAPLPPLSPAAPGGGAIVVAPQGDMEWNPQILTALTYTGNSGPATSTLHIEFTVAAAGPYNHTSTLRNIMVGLTIPADAVVDPVTGSITAQHTGGQGNAGRWTYLSTTTPSNGVKTVFYLFSGTLVQWMSAGQVTVLFAVPRPVPPNSAPKFNLTMLATAEGGVQSSKTAVAQVRV